MTSDLVVDASFVTALLCEHRESVRTWAIELVEKSELAAPHLMPVEVTGALRRLEHRGLLTSSIATLAQSDLTELGVDLYPFEPFTSRVWELRHATTSYDAWYVALAERLGASIATLDQRLARTPEVRCTFVLPP